MANLTERLAAAKAKQEETNSIKKAAEAAEKARKEQETKKDALTAERERVTATLAGAEQAAADASTALAEVTVMEEQGDLESEVAKELAAIKSEAYASLAAFKETKQRLTEIDAELKTLNEPGHAEAMDDPLEIATSAPKKKEMTEEEKRESMIKLESAITSDHITQDTIAKLAAMFDDPTWKKQANLLFEEAMETKNDEAGEAIAKIFIQRNLYTIEKSIEEAAIDGDDPNDPVEEIRIVKRALRKNNGFRLSNENKKFKDTVYDAVIRETFRCISRLLDNTVEMSEWEKPYYAKEVSSLLGKAYRNIHSYDDDNREGAGPPKEIIDTTQKLLTATRGIKYIQTPRNYEQQEARMNFDRLESVIHRDQP